MIRCADLLCNNATNTSRISVAPIDSDFRVVLPKSFDIIITDMSKTTMPIVKSAMLSSYTSTARLGFNIFGLEDVGILF